MTKQKMPCTWDDQSSCDSCAINSDLNCKWKKEHLSFFLWISLPLMVLQAIAYLFLSFSIDTYAPLIAYLLFWPVVLGGFESKFLCSHCPYYAKEGATLHCLANHGIFRLWKYNPSPLSKLEKKLMKSLVFTIGIIMPAVSDIGLLVFLLKTSPSYLNSALILLGAHAVLIVLFEILVAKVALKSVCARCVNFSCPFNRVSKAVVDQYLETNEEMKSAWIKSGYKIG